MCGQPSSSSSQRRGLTLPAIRQVEASHPRPPSVVASSSQRYSRLWQVVTGHSCPLRSAAASSSQRYGRLWQVVASHPHPPSVTVGRGQPSSSSQRHGRSWSAILVLPASRPHPPSVTAVCCRPSSSSQRCGLVLPALQQVLAGHPRPPSVPNPLSLIRLSLSLAALGRLILISG